jgi:hypothetical protein
MVNLDRDICVFMCRCKMSVFMYMYIHVYNKFYTCYIYINSSFELIYLINSNDKILTIINELMIRMNLRKKNC